MQHPRIFGQGYIGRWPTNIAPCFIRSMCDPVQGWDTLVRGTIAKGRFVQGAQHPRTFGQGHIGQGHINPASSKGNRAEHSVRFWLSCSLRRWEYFPNYFSVSLPETIRCEKRAQKELWALLAIGWQLAICWKSPRLSRWWRPFLAWSVSIDGTLNPFADFSNV